MSKYKWRKIQLLKQFGIELSKQELSHLSALQTEIAVDNWGRGLIMRYLKDD